MLAMASDDASPYQTWGLTCCSTCAQFSKQLQGFLKAVLAEQLKGVQVVDVAHPLLSLLGRLIRLFLQIKLLLESCEQWGQTMITHGHSRSKYA